MIVPSCGSLDAELVLIGEQPGNRETTQPFVGHAGKLLNGVLEETGIERNACYITNVVKKKGTPLSKYHTKKGFTSEGKVCVRELHKELSRLTKPKVIVPLGNVALEALLRLTGINKWQRSRFYSKDYDCLIIPCIHPASVLGGKFQDRYLLWRVFTFVKQILTDTLEFPPAEIGVRPNYAQVIKYLKEIKQAGLLGKHVAYDIEILGENHDKYIVCLSFSCEGKALSIPFTRFEGLRVVSYFFAEQECAIWSLIAEILEDKRILKIAQNGSFDMHLTLKQMGISLRNVHDTMVAQNILMKDFPKGLDFITMWWTPLNYYKDDGKVFLGGMTASKQEKSWRYNALDSYVCDVAYPQQKELLIKTGNWEVFKWQCAQIEALVFMMERGMKTDLDEIQKLHNELLFSAEDLQRQLNEVARERTGIPDYTLNPNSPKQLREYFYSVLGLKPYINRSTGKATTDDSALQRLKKPVASRRVVNSIASDEVVSRVKNSLKQTTALKEASIIMDIRKKKKLANTYLMREKFDIDARIRCSYNPAGTQFSRLSSSKSIFGTGMNLQNWPHHLMGFMVPDDGYIYVSPDLSQAENRIVAYVADCTPMMNAFERSDDVHSLTTKLIQRLWYGTDEHGLDVRDKSPIGDGSKKWRDWGKRANHGLNYGYGAPAFAEKYEIEERVAYRIVNAYHAGYPEVRYNFHKLCEDGIKKNRTIENLMGRKIIFYGRPDRNTFQQGYSCIPQSTVGDIIIKHGLIPLYYDTERFEHVELLNQVHDSIGFQIPLSVGWTEIARICLDLKKELEVTLTAPINKREFVIPVDFTFGWNMNKDDAKKSVDFAASKIPNDSAIFGNMIQTSMEALR